MFRKDLVLSKFFAITPGASVLAPTPDALWTGTGGTLTFEGADDSATQTITAPANTVLPFRVRRVTAFSGTGLLGAN